LDTDGSAAATRRRLRSGLAPPAIDWIRAYDRRWLTSDVVGGLAAGAVVIPQAMAYATIANLPVEVGLYTCMVPMVVYVLLGGSRTMSVSTTSTVAVLTGSTLIAAGIADDAVEPERELATLTLLVGAILLVARLLRLGKLVDNISEATLVGIKIGVGLTVAASQLPKLLGIDGDPDADNFVASMRGVVDDLSDVSVTTTVFSVATIALLLGLRRVAPKVPGPLVAVALGITLVAAGSIDDHGVALIAEVPSGLPVPVAPATDRIPELLPGAFAIAIMVYLETVSVARNLRRPDEPAIDNDAEMVANAATCIGGAFFRAMPSAGGFSQSAINQSAGARTQLSELVTASLAVACALFLGSVLSDLPQATLGCLVIVAVLGLVQPSELARFWRLDKVEFWVAVTAAAAGLLAGLLVAVLVGVLLTLFLVLRELNRIELLELQLDDADGRDVHIAHDATGRLPGLLMLRFDGPLYTANIRTANRQVVDAVDAAPGTRVLVLDMAAVAHLTVMVMDEGLQLERELADRDVELWIAGLPPHALATARKVEHWSDLERTGHIYPTALAAALAFRREARP
jgi:sulfate permease, SulP family